MGDIERKPLPALWPSPAEFADVGDLMLLVFTQDGAPTWQVRRRAAADRPDDLVLDGRADTFEAGKAAAFFEAKAVLGLLSDERLPHTCSSPTSGMRTTFGQHGLARRAVSE